jgi:spore germination cell wall hydrolase CwlJ-like protein
MLNRSHLSLPLLLAMASCVPPIAARQSASLSVAPALQPRKQATERPLPLPPVEAVAPGHAAEPFVTAGRTERDMRASVQCLAAAVYYEARSEGVEGQRAVAQIVLNRVRHPAFPNSVCGVVYQGSQRRTGCQFSFTCDGSMRRAREPGAWAQAQRIAGAALAGSVYGPVGLATHYHTTAIHPWWADAMRRAVTIGSHVFYRWRGEWGDRLAARRPLTAEVHVAVAQRAQPVMPASATLGVRIHRGAAEAAPEPALAEFGVRIHRSSGPGPALAEAEPGLGPMQEDAPAATLR